MVGYTKNQLNEISRLLLSNVRVKVIEELPSCMKQIVTSSPILL